MIELADFENLAIEAKENETADLINRMHLADFAVDHDYLYRNEDPPPRLARWLAHLWGQSTTHSVNVLARMAEVFDEDDIRPDVPLSLYRAVMETNDPAYALRLATDYEFRRQELGEEFTKTDKKGIWSSAQLRRFYDIKRGRHYSDALRGRGPVTEWDILAGRLTVEGMPLSGDPPEGQVEVTVRRVLEKENDDRTN